jgi:hypothetical protein
MQIGQIAGGTCTYDACATDGQCAAGDVCECGTADGTQGRTANQCLASGCVVDSDCGQGGTCSPTWSTSCGNRFGVVGYFCHTPEQCTKGECANDSDCQGDGGSPEGYCAWDMTVSAWTCEYGVCAG